MSLVELFCERLKFKEGGVQTAAGFFFAGVFAEGFFPVPGVALLFAVPCLLLIFLERPPRSNVHVLFFILLCMSFYYWFFLFFGGAGFDFHVAGRLLYFYLMFFVFVWGAVQFDPCSFLRGFWSGLLPMAVIASLLGVFKTVLQERGFVVSGLVDMYEVFSVDYPYGASLRADYNIFALSLMVAIIGVVLRVFNSWGWGLFRALLCLALFLMTLYFLGSRRAYFISIVIFIWGAFVSFRFRGRAGVGFYFGACLAFVGVLVLLSQLVLSGKSYSSYQRFPGAILQSGVSGTGELKLSSAAVESASDREALDSSLSKDRRDYPGQIITYTPGRLISTVASANEFGLASRLVRWEFALDLWMENGWFLGRGFSYHKIFSCEFVNCEYPDYPHNFILSEILLAGVVGGIFSVLVVLLVVFVVIRSGAIFWLSGAGSVVLLGFPYILISGDGIFSIPQVVACFFFVLLFSRSGPDFLFARRG